MSEQNKLVLRKQQTSLCTNCKRQTSINLLYVCSSGHDICINCSLKLVRCLICSKSISDSPRFFCTYKKFGCQFKGIFDAVRTHENDCEYKEFFCPFESENNECAWYEISQDLVEHVRSVHKNSVLVGELLEGELPRKDKSWVIVAFDKVFKSYFWIYEFHVEWVLKFVGPQREADLYQYQLQIYQNGTIFFDRIFTCLGYNNISLERCPTFSVGELKGKLERGRVTYCLKIIKSVACQLQIKE